jgi:hypothetical protein
MSKTNSTFNQNQIMSKFQLTFTSQFVNFEEHIESPSDLAFFLSSSSNIFIDLELALTKHKLDFDAYKPNPK